MGTMAAEVTHSSGVLTIRTKAFCFGSSCCTTDAGSPTTPVTQSIVVFASHPQRFRAALNGAARSELNKVEFRSRCSISSRSAQRRSAQNRLADSPKLYPMTPSGSTPNDRMMSEHSVQQETCAKDLAGNSPSLRWGPFQKSSAAYWLRRNWFSSAAARMLGNKGQAAGPCPENDFPNLDTRTRSYHEPQPLGFGASALNRRFEPATRPRPGRRTPHDIFHQARFAAAATSAWPMRQSAALAPSFPIVRAVRGTRKTPPTLGRNQGLTCQSGSNACGN